MRTVTIHPPKTPVSKGSNSFSIATLPNWCKMPGPPAPFVPVVLPNIGRSALSPRGYSTTVTMEGHPVAIMGASFNSIGDIASKGTGGGVLSMNTHGPTKFIAPGSLTVQVQGKNVHLLSDIMSNNNGPAGSPPNAATLAGTVHIPIVVFDGNLDALAEECNKQVNNCPPPPDTKDCKTLGTKKHKCCENAIKKYNEKNADSKYQSEVPFDQNNQRLSADAESLARSKANEAYHAAKAAQQSTKGVWARNYFSNGGAAFKADVLEVGPDGKVKRAYDFKFNCKPEKPPSKHLMSRAQRDKYTSAGLPEPDIIHKDGRKC